MSFYRTGGFTLATYIFLLCFTISLCLVMYGSRGLRMSETTCVIGDVSLGAIDVVPTVNTMQSPKMFDGRAYKDSHMSDRPNQIISKIQFSI